MTNLELFLKPNKVQKPNRFYAPTKSMCDAKGKPLEWEFKHVSTKESDAIKKECTKAVPTGKYGQYRNELDADKYMEKMIVKATVFPDLFNKELQDSYGVKTPEDLLKEMIDDPKEYNSLVEFVGELTDEKDINEKVKEAKN
jgi:hypothetical protein